jgi:bacteriorhodopsin
MINNNNPLIMTTAYVSLAFQILAGLVGLHGVTIPLPEEHQVLKDIMIMETVVQLIEFCFYIWLVLHLKNLRHEVTYVRYFDWMLSTPIMLLGTILYFEYNNAKDMGILYTTWNILGDNWRTILLFLVANWVMLLAGFMAERQKVSRMFGFIVGMIGFLFSFWTIYDNFVGNNRINQILYAIMFVLWLMYGFAFMFPYFVKNAMYNVLDIFAKNFYGLYVYWLIMGVRS